MAGRDWDADDWEIVLTEGRFELDKEDGGGNMIKDDCNKHGDDNCDDYYDDMSCKV